MLNIYWYFHYKNKLKNSFSEINNEKDESIIAPATNLYPY